MKGGADRDRRLDRGVHGSIHDEAEPNADKDKMRNEPLRNNRVQGLVLQTQRRAM